MTRYRSHQEYLPSHLRDRLYLDYPLDNLLCRSCLLTDYDDQLRDQLIALDASVRRLRQAEAGSTEGGEKMTAANGALTEATLAVRTSKHDLDTAADPCRYAGDFGGVRLPRRRATESEKQAADSFGDTGNILIRGRAGTCKSTLAMQIATAATVAPNHFMAMFISLEEPPAQVLAKCQEMNWHRHWRALNHLTDLDMHSSSAKLAEELDRVLRGDESLPEPRVLLPSLSPRSLRPAPGVDNTFQVRYEQLERLLRGFRHLRDYPPKHRPPLPQLRVACLDSLSALADRPLTREELYRVFDLFKTYEIFGVVTAETQQGEESDAMDYLADVVIDLSANSDGGYEVRYFQIKKSRHQHQVYGQHPFVVRNYDSAQFHLGYDEPDKLFQAISVFPSIHYTVMALDRKQRGNGSRPLAVPQDSAADSCEPPDGSKPFEIGIKGLRNILAGGLTRPAVVMVTGPRGTYKTHIARNFLLDGVARKETVLLLHLGGRQQFTPKSWSGPLLLSKPWLVSDDVKSLPGRPEERWARFTPAGKECGLRDLKNAKLSRYVWELDKESADRVAGSRRTYLVELDFAPGALLPEQFIKFVRDVFRQCSAEPKRIVIDDVSLISTSYPFLNSSKTAGELFLSALVHLARYYECDMILNGTSGENQASEVVVQRAATLADTVLTCTYSDVFGARFITVLGEGLMAGKLHSTQEGKRHEYGEYVPGVIVPGNAGEFSVDQERLEGLVGFAEGRVQRPGLVLSVFSEGPILRQYNAGLRALVERSLATGARARGRRESAQGDVSVLTFDSLRSTPLHASLELLHGNPIDKTVVCALDESSAVQSRSDDIDKLLCDISGMYDGRRVGSWSAYREQLWVGSNGPGRKHIVAAPYYSNVLLFAYRRDWQAGAAGAVVNASGRVKSWADLVQRCPGHLEIGDWSKETLGCIMLDILFKFLDDRGGQATRVVDLLELEEQLEQVTGEWQALRKLRQERKLTLPPPSSSAPSRPVERKASELELSESSPYYICWYTQLRELIDKRPQLAPLLEVAALPGGGITGDWYLGVVRGSVSVKLGESILRLLSKQKEDRRRLLEGVGLPVQKQVARNLRRAWPRGEPTLDKVLKIHEQAHKRSELEDYPEAQESLGELGNQVLRRIEDDAELEGLLRRVVAILRTELLPDQVNV